MSARILRAPDDTRSWTPLNAPENGWRDGDGVVWVRARNDEIPELVIEFPRQRGIAPMPLVRATESSTVKRATKKARKEKRELEKRGLDS